MKLKAIEAICKAKKTIVVTGGCNEWWIGDGNSLYPIYDLTEFNENIAFTIFDIPEDARGKWNYEWRSVEAINLGDVDETERLAECFATKIHYDGRTLIAVRTRRHISFIDVEYLKPYKRGSYEVYERVSGTGGVYFAIKNGFNLIGVISPYDCVREEFSEEIGQISRLIQERVKERTVTQSDGKEVSGTV